MVIFGGIFLVMMVFMLIIVFLLIVSGLLGVFCFRMVFVLM